MPGIIIQLVNFPNIYNIWNTELLGIYIEEEEEEEEKKEEEEEEKKEEEMIFFFLL